MIGQKKIILNLLAVTDGGQVTRAKALLRNFSKFDSNSELIILRRKGSLDFCDEIDDISHKIIEASLGGPILRSLRRLFWENTILKIIILKENPQIYLTFSHYIPRIIEKSIFSIMGVTNLAPFCSPLLVNESIIMRIKMKLLKGLILTSARRTDHIISLSKKCKEILELNGVESKKIKVIHNGLDKDFVFEEKNSIAILDKYNINSKYILYVSSFFPYKKFETVISAYKKLSRELKEEYKLILVGPIKNRRYHKSLKKLGGIDFSKKNIVFLDEVPKQELNYFYSNADVFIFASSIENCPNILLEAMSFSCPIICSSSEPMPEFGGDAMIYFDVNNSDDLKNKIERLISDPNQIRKLKEKSRLRAESFSWYDFTQQVASIYL